MNIETIRSNTLQNQKWLERAVLVLDDKKLWRDPQDEKTGSYIAAWIRRQRQQNVKLGECLTGDMWPGRARHLVKDYANELLVLSLEKAKSDVERYKELMEKAKSDVERYKELTNNTRKRIRQLSRAINTLQKHKEAV